MHNKMVIQKNIINMQNKTTVRYIKRNYSLYLMIMPGVVIFFLFSYLPIFGILMAFENYSPVKGFFGSTWVGLTHFKDFFNDPYFWRITGNTFAFGLWSILFFPSPIIFALLLNEIQNQRLKKVFQSISIFPIFISIVIVIGLIQDTLNPSTGVITLFAQAFGTQVPDLLAEPLAFRPIYFISTLWNTVGYSSILYLAAISGINQELYEAAVIDGAGRFRQMWHITIPCITPTITLLLIIQIGNFLLAGDFQKIILMYNPLTYETADTIGTYVYRSGILGTSASYSAAINVLFSLASATLVICANRLSKKLGKGSLF